jgi:hypothetical protein
MIILNFMKNLRLSNISLCVVKFLLRAKEGEREGYREREKKREIERTREKR